MTDVLLDYFGEVVLTKEISVTSVLNKLKFNRSLPNSILNRLFIDLGINKEKINFREFILIFVFFYESRFNATFEHYLILFEKV